MRKKAGNSQRARAAFEKATAPGAKFPEIDDARRRLAVLGLVVLLLSDAGGFDPSDSGQPDLRAPWPSRARRIAGGTARLPRARLRARSTSSGGATRPASAFRYCSVAGGARRGAATSRAAPGRPCRQQVEVEGGPALPVGVKRQGPRERVRVAELVEPPRQPVEDPHEIQAVASGPGG